MSTDEMIAPVAEAGFIFQGRRVEDADDIDLGTARAVPVEVEQVLRGTDVLRQQVGRTVALVSAGEDVPSEAHVYFTDCVSLGEPIVVRERTRRFASNEALREVSEATEIVAELPLYERVIAADVIILGEVLSSAPLDESRRVRSEHDPDWWVARIAVEDTVKGRVRTKRLDVLFANSLDIAWYRSPKLHEGVRGAFLLHRPDGRDELPELSQLPAAILMAVDPQDHQPPERLTDVARMLAVGSEES